jgi:hypothetical protein
VDYYVFDEKDPVIQAYSRIYPGIFKKSDQMPPELATQVRYPRDIFDLQMTVYANYHQTDPEVFYQQEDAWESAKGYHAQEALDIKPYYLTLEMIEQGRFDFLLFYPMSPKGQNNLRALSVVGCDKPYYGKVIVYELPKGELVLGPSQVYSLINHLPIPLADSERISSRFFILPLVFLIILGSIHLQDHLTKHETRPLAQDIFSLGLLFLMAHDLYQHTRLWRVKNMYTLFISTPVDYRANVLDHPDPPYINALIVGSVVSLLTLAVLLVLSLFQHFSNRFERIKDE